MLRPGTRGSVLRRVLSTIVIATLAVTALSGCIPGAPGAPGSGGDRPEQRLYTGPIPEPADLPNYAGMGTPPMPPEPPADMTDEAAMAEYQKQVEQYLEDVTAYQEFAENQQGDTVGFAERVYELAEATRTSDEASVAAWQSLLVAAGIAVGYGEQMVDVNGMTGAGIPMTMAELRLHTLLGTYDTRISLRQLASMLGGFGDLPDDALLEDLQEDLNLAMTDSFGMVFAALDPQPIEPYRYGVTDEQRIDETSYTGAQVALLLRRLSVDLLSYADTLGGTDTVGYTPERNAGFEALTASAHRVLDADSGCSLGDDETPWEAEGRRNSSKGIGYLFGKLIDKMAESTPGMKDVKTVLSGAQAALAVSTLLAKLMALNAGFSINESPLERTKNLTPGNRGTVAVRLSYPKNLMADVTGCLALALTPFGFDVADFEGGAAKGIDAELVLKSERVWYSTERGGSETFRQTSPENGIVTFPLLGAPQQERLPEGAEPEEVMVPVRLETNIEGSDPVKDLTAAFWDAISPGAVGIISNVVARMKLLVFGWEFPLKDWELIADFDVRLDATVHSHAGASSSWTGDCGSFTYNESVTTSGTISTPETARVTIEYVTEVIDGNPVKGPVMYPVGSSIDEINISLQGAELVHFPVRYDATRSHDEPGKNPMPSHYIDPSTGSCGDGIGGWTPPTPDCGARNYLDLVSIVLKDGALVVLGNYDDRDDPWKHCGSLGRMSNPLTAPQQMSHCEAPEVSGGIMPTVDAIYNKLKDTFEIPGTVKCYVDEPGYLDNYTFEWKLTFCRVNDEGTSSC